MKAYPNVTIFNHPLIRHKVAILRDARTSMKEFRELIEEITTLMTFECLKEGVPTEKFLSSFYNIRKLDPVPFPPSLYPMDFDRARAARIALGSNAEGKPMILWAEGAAKFGYVPGQGSCGASLSEMSRLCAQMGMVNAVNLDGGGSAQILLHNRRSLEISDRNRVDHSEAERPVPLALMVR